MLQGGYTLFTEGVIHEGGYIRAFRVVIMAIGKIVCKSDVIAINI